MSQTPDWDAIRKAVLDRHGSDCSVDHQWPEPVVFTGDDPSIVAMRPDEHDPA